MSASSHIFQAFALTPSERAMITEEVTDKITKIINKEGDLPPYFSKITQYILANKEFINNNLPLFIEAVLSELSVTKAFIVGNGVTMDNFNDWGSKLRELGGRTTKQFIATLQEIGLPNDNEEADDMMELCTYKTSEKMMEQWLKPLDVQKEIQEVNPSSTSSASPSPTHTYVHHTYSADHWANDNTKDGTCIGFVTFNNIQIYALKLNPTDRRGYRALVTLIGEDNTNIQTTFNRQYTTAEQRGLSEVTAFVIEIFKKMGLPIVQTAQAGNNSQSLDESGVTHIGNLKEPSMLHTHIWGRGNPAQEYIPGVPLDGPKPGEMFDMMAKTPSVAGNQKKVSWDPKLLEISLQLFKKLIHEYINSSEFSKEFSGLLKIKIFQPERDKAVEKTSQIGLFKSASASDTLANKIQKITLPESQSPIQ
ncbi:MAG: hypothetical protein P4L65_09760 [Legionella sp.]|nr:hypothetical protein [Legionella sp.]